MKKKLISTMVSVCLLCACVLTPCSLLSVSAKEVEYDQASALKYILSMEGKAIDRDGTGLDCVDLVKAYFADVGGRPMVSIGSAYNYANTEYDGALPTGWIRCTPGDGYIPKPGDVAVWKANKGVAKANGHVALVTEVKKNGGKYQIKYLEQSTGTNKPAAICKNYLDADNPSCYIVPTFNQTLTEEMILASPGRFTVLVLNNTGPVGFHFPADFFSGRWQETTYTADSAIDEVKNAANSFLDNITEFQNNYVAVVSYNGTATVVCEFTNDIDKLKASLETIPVYKEEEEETSADETSADETSSAETSESEEENNDNTSVANITVGLTCAETLLAKATNSAAVKNIVLCTTGLSDAGEYSETGKYSPDDETVPSSWYNSGTGIELYKTANVAVATADRIKKSGTVIYTLGTFKPIESALPSDGQGLANFFRTTTKDIASSEDHYFPLEDTENLVISFDDVEGAIDGKQETYIYTNKGETPILFDTTLSSLIVSERSVQYNPKLAYMLMALSDAAYIQNKAEKGITIEESSIYRSYESIGLKDIKTFNYYDDPDDPKYGSDNVAFTIGWQSLPNSKKMIVVTIRGTFGDQMDSPDWQSNFNLGEAESKIALHRGFDAAAKKVMRELIKYTSGTDTKNTVYVLTGHSRGAGVANLVSLKLMEKGVPMENLYDYNFACPDVARAYGAAWNPLGKYCNMFNVINCGDPVGRIPGVLGTLLSFGSDEIVNLVSTFLNGEIQIQGSSDNWSTPETSWGKFGLTCWFSKDWNEDSEIGIRFAAHNTSEYLDYLSQLNSEYAFKGWAEFDLKSLLNTDWSGLFAGVFCPVDVTITTLDGKLLVSVKDGVVAYGKDVEFGKVVALTEGDKKVFFLSGYEKVNILFEGTDAGKMAYVYSKISLADDKLTEADVFKNVELSDGKTMRSTVSLKKLANTTLFRTNKKGQVVARIDKDGVETKVLRFDTIMIISSVVAFLGLGALITVSIMIKRKKNAKTMRKRRNNS